MSKLEKLGKLRKRLIIIMVILLVIMLSLIVMFILPKTSPKYNAGYKARPYTNYYCLAKGSVCSPEDIYNSIKVTIPVNASQAYDFYLISNDKDTATFIMASNLVDDTDWHIEGINFRGPTKALKTLIEETNNWNGLNTIQEYKYEDSGYKLYQEHCSTTENQLADLLYDCSTRTVKARGYKGFEIDPTGLTINFNVPKDSNMKDNAFFSNRHIYARLASVEELYDISSGLDFPDWLIDNLAENEGYWTMSSSTSSTYNYNEAAYGVVNYEGETRIVELRTLNEANEVFKHNGIRPVITIEK